MDKFDWVLFRRLFAVFSIIGVGLWVILFIGTWQSEEWTSFNLWVSLDRGVAQHRLYRYHGCGFGRSGCNSEEKVDGRGGAVPNGLVPLRTSLRATLPNVTVDRTGLGRATSA